VEGVKPPPSCVEPDCQAGGREGGREGRSPPCPPMKALGMIVPAHMLLVGGLACWWVSRSRLAAWQQLCWQEQLATSLG
jgi:hypothetical protein